MKIKVGDTVIVTSGSRNDRKKIGKVVSIGRTENLVVVEGINLKKKISRDASGKKTTISVEYPVHASNVMFYDEKTKTGTRLGIEGTKKTKQRVTKKSATKLV